MRSVLSLAALAPLFVVAAASPFLLPSGASREDIAPLISPDRHTIIPSSYIVVFKDHVTPHAAAAHQEWIQELHAVSESSRMELRKRSEVPLLDDLFTGLKHTFNIADSLMGYAGHFGDNVLEQIRRHPDVELVEMDSEVHTMASEPELEKSAPWGLARISHRDGLSFGNFNKYLYAADGGEGVDVYVIDTGTYTDHVDFEGRASWGATIPTGDEDKDGNGHGTHCSGTIAGKKYGVAKKAHIKAVKVLRSNGTGSMSDVVKGVEFAANEHAKAVKAARDGKRKGFKGSTANMSLGGGKSPALDQAVNAAVKLGLHFAVAAGNDNSDSCNTSPASAERAVTVGASTLTDERAYFSNFGPCNDIFAPGLNILSTWIGSKTAINTISGTSMASPHIAGLLAYMLSLQPSKDSDYSVAEISPKKLKSVLVSIATRGALSDVPSDTHNVLAWNGGGSSNFTEIVNKGSYTVGLKESQMPPYPHGRTQEEYDSEPTIEDRLRHVTQELEDIGEEISRTVEAQVHDLDSQIAAELRGFMEH